jgi:protein TonB
VVEAPLRKRVPATVHVLFVVAPDGRVESPLVQKSTDAMFERSALAAVKQWRFEPGKKNGEAVRFRMRVPITFPES